MAAHPRVEAAACQGKNGYVAKSTADRVLNRMLTRKRGVRSPDAQGKLNVYRCLICNLWHLGHKA